ncbi:hypothetical protein ATY76_14360 [Rhizobium sp. R339]|uniref:hypothetical protein n=1 Tax=Rhizobium sp. R339 TaxID=1764273 RepID=UPI000B533E76|nr:hypothetical protein [Rhizobium sp. R339]OWV68085.1 hypothetical protein ATY76_14360 [Rhizobium sp. R339]
MAESEVENRAQEGPQVKAETWFALAITAVVLTSILFATAGLWIFTDDPVKTLPRAQAFTPFGAAMIALVTFFTVAWRGVLNARQLDYQAEQLKYQANQVAQVVRQNDTKEDENLAKLLLDGAKLITETEKLPQLIAGVTALEIVIKDERRRYSVEAVDLLVDVLTETYGSKGLARSRRAVLAALRIAEDKGVNSRVQGMFKRDKATIVNRGEWDFIPAVSRLFFEGGTISTREYARMAGRIVRLTNVVVSGANVDFRKTTMKECIFDMCTISEISAGDLRAHKFQFCDFTNATIGLGGGTLRDIKLKEGFNLYRDGHPPRDETGNSLADFFWKEEELPNDLDEALFLS